MTLGRCPLSIFCSCETPLSQPSLRLSPVIDSGLVGSTGCHESTGCSRLLNQVGERGTVALCQARSQLPHLLHEFYSKFQVFYGKPVCKFHVFCSKPVHSRPFRNQSGGGGGYRGSVPIPCGAAAPPRETTGYEALRRAQRVAAGEEGGGSLPEVGGYFMPFQA